MRHALLLGLLTLGCVGAERPAPVVSEAFEDPVDDMVIGPDSAADAFGLVESSPQALSILRLVNDASTDELTARAGLRLASRVAAAIVQRRAGPDGVEHTIDDEPYRTLVELDAVPNVGRTVFQRLQTFVEAQPIDDAACAATDARPFPLELVVAPGPVEARLLSLLAGARRSIDVTIYQFTSTPVRRALESAAARGVRVRVILDRAQSENAALVTRLTASGIEARLSSAAFVYTHQKTITVDERLTLVFSGNLETRSFETSRNYGVIDRDFEDVRDFDTLFEADWTDRTPVLACTRLVYSPVTSRTRILDFVAAAEHALDVEAMYVTDRRVIEALVAAKRRGVAVRVLFNDPSFGIGDSTATARTLRNAGIEVRRLPSLFIHAKVIIVDRSWFFVGSENFSDNSLDRNREAGVVLGASDVDVAAALAVLETDWGRAVAF